MGSAGTGGFGGGFVPGAGGGPFSDDHFCNSGSGTFEQAAPAVAATPPPPISGGTLAVLADGTLVVADSDRDDVALVSTTNEVRHIALQPGDEPGRVAAGPAGRAFVALRRGGAVVELDLATASIRARHSVCAAPRGLVWSAPRQALTVACATGELVELRFEKGQVERTTTTPADDLRDVFLVGNDLYLSTFRDARLYRQARDGTVTAQPGPRVVRQIGFGGSLEFEADGGFDGGSLRDPEFVPHVAWRTVQVATGALMVHQRAQSTPLQAVACTGYGGAPSVNNLGIVHTAVTRFRPEGSEQVALLRAAVLPVDLAATFNEERLALATPGGVWLKRGGFDFERLSFPDGEYTSVGFRGLTLVAFDRLNASLAFQDADGLRATLSLYATPRDVASTGHRLFHKSGAAQLACASCHPEGGEDGNVWQLAEGPRRTPSLRGGLKGTEPFHWAGDLASIRALVSEVMQRRMGGPGQTSERSAALLDWLDAQPRLAAPPGDATAIERGRLLFTAPEVGCASCHSGAQGTNNANATAGTGPALQVPRLVELAYRAPYFHDGRVPTLAARFTPVGGGDAHGHVSNLSTRQVDDLVAYLRSR